MPIVREYQGDVLALPYDVAFAVNVEGFNDAGFAGQVARTHWPELACIGACRMGKLRMLVVRGGRAFYAIACHSLQGEWKLDTITDALNRIHKVQELLDDETPVAVVWMGRGVVGALTGVNPDETRAAIHASTLPTVLAYL